MENTPAEGDASEATGRTGRRGVTRGLALLAACVVAYVVLGRWFTHTLEAGRAVDSCTWDGVQVEECAGYTWSILQVHHQLVRARGRMSARSCNDFVRAASETAMRSPADATACGPSDPDLWFAVSCEAAGLADRTRCFGCVGRYPTNDDYGFYWGADDACTEVTVLQLGNVAPTDVPRCLQSGGEHAACPWGDPHLPALGGS